MELSASFMPTRGARFPHTLSPLLHHQSKDYCPINILDNQETHQASYEAPYWSEPIPTKINFSRASDTVHADLNSKTEKPRYGGTDPAKYKTTICRNWETTGVCNFRGCTFAHGREELRPSRTSPKNDHVAAGACLLEEDCKPTLSSVNHPKENSAASLANVDQALQTLCDAIRQERASYSETSTGPQYALGIMLRREKTFKIQREKDQQEITELHERIQHLEKIVIQLHIEKCSTQSDENHENTTNINRNSKENADSPKRNFHESVPSISIAENLNESKDNSENVDSLNQNLTILSLLKAVNRIPDNV